MPFSDIHPHFGPVAAAIAGVLFGYALLVEPLWGRSVYRRLVRRREQDPAALIRTFRLTIAAQWAWMALILLAVAVAPALCWAISAYARRGPIRWSSRSSGCWPCPPRPGRSRGVRPPAVARRRRSRATSRRCFRVVVHVFIDRNGLLLTRAPAPADGVSDLP